jgi:hypothetical protein
LALPSADRDGGLAATVAGSPSWNVFFADLLGPLSEALRRGSMEPTLRDHTVAAPDENDEDSSPRRLT